MRPACRVFETADLAAVIKFKERHFRKIHLFSAKQNELQEKYYVAEAKRQETLRLMDVEGILSPKLNFFINLTLV